MNARVEQMNGKNGPVKNQFIIHTDKGTFFQSYKTVIARRMNGKITLDVNAWDYSITTGKYRNIFLGESKRETLKKITSGEYTLENLN